MGQGRGTRVSLPVHPRPKQTQPARTRRAWVCGPVGLWVFVLFFLRIFFFFLLFSEPLVPHTISPKKGPWGQRLKRGWCSKGELEGR